jgi:sec-independent protein translocase protein TatB
VVGPDKLPGLAKTVAKQILELKKAANSLKDSLDEELKDEKEALQEIAAPLNDLDIRLPDFDEMHSDTGGGDLPNHVDAVASPHADVVTSEEEVVPEADTVTDVDLPAGEEQKS